MDTPHNLPARTAIGLAAAAHLEIALNAAEAGQPAAVIGALAAIDEDAWKAILQRFPTLPNLIQEWSRTR